MTTDSILSPGPVGACGFRGVILTTTSKPEVTLPKTAWQDCPRAVQSLGEPSGFSPSRWGVGAWVMKNWLPFVACPACIPALAMDKIPAESCRASGWNSFWNVYPGPPVPVPVGSPAWDMKPGITRWNVVPSK